MVVEAQQPAQAQVVKMAAQAVVVLTALAQAELVQQDKVMLVVQVVLHKALVTLKQAVVVELALLVAQVQLLPTEEV